MKLSKEDKKKLEEQYEKVWHGDAKMVDYCVKRTSCIFETRGYIIDFDKPRIETRFCFGEHGYDYDEVSDYCHRMSESEAYFMRENMEGTVAFDTIAAIDGEGGRHWRKLYPSIKPRSYCIQDEDCILAVLDWTEDVSKWREDPMALTEAEIAELRQLMVEEQEKFEKRLKTYLKRYGMSKCHFWTYWADR